MAIRPITFTDCSVAARDHGVLFGSMIAEGRIKGGNISVSGSVVTIQAGYIIVCGRLIELTSSQTIQCENTDQFAQVVMSVSEEGNVSIDVRYSSTSTGFAELTRGDINAGGQLYELELCVVHIIPDSTSTVEKSIPLSRHRIYVSSTQPADWEEGDLWFVRGT